MVPINNITGLYESWHERLSVPVVKQKNMGDVRLDGHLKAIHDIPVSVGALISVYADLCPADNLIVLISSPVDGVPSSPSEPFEVDANMLSPTNAAVMTVGARPRAKSQDGGWAPAILRERFIEDLLILIQKAAKQCGAKTVVLSGADIAANIALCLSAGFHGSCAYVENPQLDRKHAISFTSGTESKHINETVPELYERIAPYNFTIVRQDIEVDHRTLVAYRNFKNMYFIQTAEGWDDSGQKGFFLRDNFYNELKTDKRTQFVQNLTASLDKLNQQIKNYSIES